MTIDHLSDVTHALELADDSALQALDALPEHADRIAAIRRQLATTVTNVYRLLETIDPDPDRPPPALPPAPSRPAAASQASAAATAPSPTLAALERIAAGIVALVELKGAASLPAPAAQPQRFMNGTRGRHIARDQPELLDQIGDNLPTVGSADVAADLGIPTSAALTALMRKSGGPRVGLEVAGWVITSLGPNPGRSRLRWSRAPQPADNSQGMESQQDL